MSVRDHITKQFLLDKRDFHRYAVNLMAHVYVKDLDTCYHECTIVNISPRGACIQLPIKYRSGLPVMLDIITPYKLEHISLKGFIKHADNCRHVYGIKFYKSIDYDLLAKLRERPCPRPHLHSSSHPHS